MLSAIQSRVVNKQQATIPDAFGITDIRPYLFDQVTTVIYLPDQPGTVSVQIYNLNGQLVYTIVNGYNEVGNYSVLWNAKVHASVIIWCLWYRRAGEFSENCTG